MPLLKNDSGAGLADRLNSGSDEPAKKRPEVVRDVEMQADQDHFAPIGILVKGPNATQSEGDKFYTTEEEARQYGKVPHLAHRIGQLKPSALAAEQKPDSRWADSGIELEPEEYLSQFPRGPFAGLATTELKARGEEAPKRRGGRPRSEEKAE